MAVVSTARRPGRLALLALLAAILTALGMSVSPHDDGAVSTTQEPWGADAAADGSFVQAVAPARAIGRLAAEPSLLSVHGPGDLTPFGAMPSTVSPPLMRLGGQHIRVTPRLRAAHRPTVGDRAPPVRQSDL